jgi:arsenate reductase
MAAGWLRHLAGGRVTVGSAGSRPAARVNPAAVAAMAEVGIDISASPSGDACPVVPGARREDWPVDDPAGLDVSAVRPIRDEIRRRVEELLAELGATPRT